MYSSHRCLSYASFVIRGISKYPLQQPLLAGKSGSRTGKQSFRNRYSSLSGVADEATEPPFPPTSGAASDGARADPDTESDVAGEPSDWRDYLAPDAWEHATIIGALIFVKGQEHRHLQFNRLGKSGIAKPASPQPWGTVWSMLLIASAAESMIEFCKAGLIF